MNKKLILCLWLLSPLWGSLAVAQSGNNAFPTSPHELESFIKNYIRNNPHILIPALESLQEQRGQNNTAWYDDDNIYKALYQQDDPSEGAIDADVTIVEFLDYNCGYCRASYNQLQNLLQKDKNLRVIYKEFPILHETSLLAARAALAAAKQGKYKPFHAHLMQSRGSINKTRISQIANKLNVDTERLFADMQADNITAKIKANYALAKQLNINGTPTFIIGESLIGGSISLQEMQKQIKLARQNQH